MRENQLLEESAAVTPWSARHAPVNHARNTAAAIAALILLGSSVSHPAAASPAGPDSSASPPRFHAASIALLRDDRLLHGSLSLSLGLAVGIPARSAPLAFGGALALGALKEWRDARHTRFDAVDIAADALGATLAALLTRSLTR